MASVKRFWLVFCKRDNIMQSARMNFTVLLTVCAILEYLLPRPLIAGPLEDGQAAFARADYVTALQKWKLLAEQGNAVAQFRLGLMYAEGRGVSQDDAEALKWYGWAASSGYAPAQLNLALMYESGPDSIRHHSRAIKWYRRAAQQGSASAQTTLGLIYDKGQGVPQNDWQALKWYELAAEQGVIVAQNNLGLVYERGRSVPRDYVQAHKWYSLAAAAGHTEATRNRDTLQPKMTPNQLIQANKLATDWTEAKLLQKAARCQAMDSTDCN